MYAIFRFKAALNAWYWVVHFRRRGSFHFRRFYDLTHGSSKKALAAAITWRDRRLAKARVLTLREFNQIRRSNNRSGVPGVHFLRPREMPRGVWQAKVTFSNGKSVTKAFGVQKYGAREAFKRAVEARVELLKLVEDRPYLYDPLAKEFAKRRVEQGSERVRYPSENIVSGKTTAVVPVKARR